MPVPPNTTAATAFVIGSLPYSNIQQVDDGLGMTYTVWYKFSAVVGTLDIGVNPINTMPAIPYAPTVNVYTGVPAALTPYLFFAATSPIQVPVGTVVDYFFEIVPNAGNPAPAVLQLDAYAFPTNAVQVGFILVNDDTPGFPGVIIDASGTPQNVTAPFPAGEAGDVLDTGELCFNDFTSGELRFFDSQLNPIPSATVTGVTSAPVIRTSKGLQHFYAGWTIFPGGPTTHMRSYDGTGVQQTAISTGAIGASFLGFAPNNDGTILYYSENQNNSPIKRWDLIANSALSDLAAATLGWFIADILVLSDGTIVSSFVQPFLGNSHVRIHTAAGTLLATYDLGTDTYPAGTFPRLAFAVNDPTTFWAWTHPVTGLLGGLSRFQEIRVSDGVVVTLIDNVVEFEGGIYQPSTAGLGDFGISFSCPFVVLRAAIPTTNTGPPPSGPPTIFVAPPAPPCPGELGPPRQDGIAPPAITDTCMGGSGTLGPPRTGV